jgi:hypothetical protein
VIQKRLIFRQQKKQLNKLSQDALPVFGGVFLNGKNDEFFEQSRFFKQKKKITKKK